MTSKPTPTRTMRVFMVIVTAFGVAAIGWAVFVLFKVWRTTAKFGSDTTISSGCAILSAGFLLPMVWLFFKVVRDAIREWPTAPHSEFTSPKLLAGFREVFTGPPAESRPVYRYGMLAIILALLGWNIQFLLSLPSDYTADRFGLLVGGLMLLFNHLSFYFRWPAKVSFALRVLAMGWVVMGLAYMVSL